ncbi:MAG TPA: FliI/YscN family ATPase [Bdellovibrionales bacterium]|nr:FliI/YscN family ATPase [Bdellovibrionales bacterium]
MITVPKINFDKYYNALDGVNLTRDIGKINRVVGFVMEGFLPGAWLGSVCEVYPSSGSAPILAEVVGFKDRSVLLMPLGDIRGVGLGARIVLQRQKATLAVGPSLLGRVLNGLGEPLDGSEPIEADDQVPLYADVENPLDRSIIDTPIDLGVRAINGLLTIGRGQRVGIMAGSGVGKSVLLGMMARNSNADVNVIALIGERGREVKEFLKNDLGEEGLKRSVVVCATSDQSPLVRMRGAFVATAISEYFCKQGKNVLLMMDSVTRFAMAQREIGLSTGEPPATKGYTPSVFAMLPKLLERAGSFESGGSITGLYTVLVEGDDMDDPIADSVRSIVDGHIVLRRTLAQKGHYPAIDVLQSTSRVMRNIISREHVHLAELFRENMAVYRDAEDLINIGAYKEGANPKIDQAIRLNDPITSYLRQNVDDPCNMEESVARLAQTLNGAEA